MSNTFVWKGTTSGPYGNASNWLLEVGGGTTAAPSIPGAGDTALIPSGTVQLSGTPGSSITVDGIGVMLTLSGASVLQPPTSIHVANPTAAATATLAIRSGVTNNTTVAASTSGAVLSIVGPQTLTNAAFLAASGGATLAVTDALVNTGTVIVEGGAIAAHATVGTVTSGGSSGTGFLQVGSGTLDLTGAVDAGQTIMFTDSSGTLVLDDPTGFAGTIIGFGTGDVIELPKSLFVAPPLLTGTSGTIVLTEGRTLTLALDPGLSFNSSDLELTTDAAGNQLLELPGVTSESWLADSGDWSTAANWSGGHLPDAADNVLLLGSTGAPFALTVSNAQTVGLVDLLSSAGTLNISGSLVANDIQQVSGGITVSAGGTLSSMTNLSVGSGDTLSIGVTGTTASAGRLAVTGSLSVDGTLSAVSGSSGQVGTLAANGAVLNVDHSSTINVGHTAVAGAAGLVIDPGSTATVTGSVMTGLLTVDGVLDVSDVAIGATVMGNGTIDITSGSLAINAGMFLPTIAFTGSGQTLLLQSNSPGGTIANFGSGTLFTHNTIDLQNLAFSPADKPIYNSTTGQLFFISDVAGKPVQATLQLQPHLNLQLSTTADASGGTELISSPPCFAAGTRIATPDGARPVQDLRPGDLVLTLGGARRTARPVRWVGHVSIDLRRHPRPETAAPVRIRAHAFAPDVPRRDLLLSPDHAVLWEGALIHAAALVNGATICRSFPGRVTYWHVELDRHGILLADDLPAESYLDLGNRGLFVGNEGTRPLHPDLTGAAGWDARACARLLVGEDAVAPARTALMRRAEALGWRRAARRGGETWLAPARRPRSVA